MDYFFGNSFSISINKYVGNTLFLNDISFEEITIIVLDECREAGLKLSDYIIQNLVLHIGLVIKRIKDGFNLDMGKVDRSIEEHKEFMVAKRILKRITCSSNIEFPDEEANYIALHLKVKSIVNDSEQMDDFSEKNKLNGELVKTLEKIEHDTGYPIKNDKQLINGLMTHFYPLLMRLKHDVSVENPLLDEIKEKYGDILKITKDYMSSNKHKELECTNLRNEKMMMIDSFIDKDCFHIIDESISKEDVITKLVDSFQKYEDQDYSTIMRQLITQREAMSSVIFSEEIAVPHPAKAIGENSHVAVAIIKDGVYWNDEFPNIKFIFLLSPSKHENGNLRNITRAIVSLTEDKDKQNKLLECNNFDEFKKIFLELI